MTTGLEICGATVALNEEMARQDAAEAAHELALSVYPLEDFYEEAWANALDETGHELLLSMVEHAPFSVLHALCTYAGVEPNQPLAEMQHEWNKRALRNYLNGWIAERQEVLQAKAVESAP